MKYTHIIWDWNGTLLDDLEVALRAVNDMLDKRGMPRTDKETYLREIEMPVSKYYEKLFDLSQISFELIAQEFTESYFKRRELLALSPYAEDALMTFRQAGARQLIISSLEQRQLEHFTQSFGIADYFDLISGAQNNLSQSKVERAQSLLNGEKRGKTLVIGDLEHDLHMAQGLGADCALVARGHQSKQTLLALETPVFDDIGQMMEWVLND